MATSATAAAHSTAVDGVTACRRVVGSGRDADRRGPPSVAARRRVRQAADEPARHGSGWRPPRGSSPWLGPSPSARRPSRRSGSRPRSGPSPASRWTTSSSPRRCAPSVSGSARPRTWSCGSARASATRCVRWPSAECSSVTTTRCWGSSPHTLASPRLRSRGRRTPAAHRRARPGGQAEPRVRRAGRAAVRRRPRAQDGAPRRAVQRGGLRKRAKEAADGQWAAVAVRTAIAAVTAATTAAVVAATSAAAVGTGT